MRVMTVLGTRPEIIRLSRLIPKLDQLCEHVLVDTGQNFDPGLRDVFFDELRIRPPDRHLGIRAETFAAQVGRIFEGTEALFREIRPDRLLVLGDTNSGLAAFVAKRMAIPVYHMEAGNRCYDDRVPEEVNRRVIDHSSDVLMPYTERSRTNLLHEGIEGRRIYVTGNPIREVVLHYGDQIEESEVHARLELEKQRYFLVTMHRAENVDVPTRLAGLVAALERVGQEYGLPVVVSTHPRTRDRMEQLGLSVTGKAVRFLPPFGFFDFVALERTAACVLTDSGTVQEECCIFGVPNVTTRDTTERPETVECGSNIIAGVGTEDVLNCVRLALSSGRTWTPPPEYMATDVADTVVRVVLAYA